MGLDMYLTAERFLWSMKDNPDYPIRQAIQAQFPELGELNDEWESTGFKVQGVKAEVGYWRKANQIHAWFVEKVQDGTDDCGTYNVDWEQLQELRTVCKVVLADPEKAEELLPVQSRFFFGSTTYDEWYLEDLKRTVEIIDKIDSELVIKTLDDGTRYSEWEFQYQASW